MHEADNDTARRRAIFPRFLPLGDSALSVEFANEIDPAVNASVQALDRAIAVSNLEGIVETAPSFRSLLIVYEPEILGLEELITALRGLLAEGLRSRSVTGRSWTIPVLYGAPSDADLLEVAAATGNSRADVVSIHSSAEYRVYFVAFMPGLPVLGGLPPALHLPRRPEPRQGIQTGIVMIGGMQGLIVPMTMPSGWYSLGQTPLRAYRPHAQDPFLFRPGDRIRFRPVTPREADALAGLPGESFMDSEA
jgi:KipI family sensor histidine kinase inhibitor